MLGISIWRQDCDRDCKRWQLTRRGKADPADALTPLPIRYGQEIPHTQVIQRAMPLDPGVYSVGAAMGCFIDGEILGQRVLGRFEVPVGDGEIKNMLGPQVP